MAKLHPPVLVTYNVVTPIVTPRVTRIATCLNQGLVLNVLNLQLLRVTLNFKLNRHVCYRIVR